jgi:hypothetical protein
VHLENIVRDAREPGRLRRFWAAALGAEPIPDDECSRLHLGGDAFLDLCFQPVPDAPSDDPRLHLDLLGGARRLDGAAGRPWVVYADPSGKRVLRARAVRRLTYGAGRRQKSPR